MVPWTCFGAVVLARWRSAGLMPVVEQFMWITKVQRMSPRRNATLCFLEAVVWGRAWMCCWEWVLASLTSWSADHVLEKLPAEVPQLIPIPGEVTAIIQKPQRYIICLAGQLLRIMKEPSGCPSALCTYWPLTGRGQILTLLPIQVWLRAESCKHCKGVLSVAPHLCL